jgi:hypothetical protein
MGIYYENNLILYPKPYKKNYQIMYLIYNFYGFIIKNNLIFYPN